MGHYVCLQPPTIATPLSLNLIRPVIIPVVVAASPFTSKPVPIAFAVPLTVFSVPLANCPAPSASTSCDLS
jgi:hypothetical protein